MKQYLTFLIILTFVIIGCGKKEQVKEMRDTGTVKNQYVKKGMEYLAASDVPQAIKNFDEAIRHDPTNSANYVILGQVYMKLNNLPKAVDTLRAATRVDPNDGNIYYLLAFAEGLDGRKEKAVDSAKRSVELFVQAKEQEKLVKAMALLQSLVDSTKAEGESLSEALQNL